MSIRSVLSRAAAIAAVPFVLVAGLLVGLAETFGVYLATVLAVAALLVWVYGAVSPETAPNINILQAGIMVLAARFIASGARPAT